MPDQLGGRVRKAAIVLIIVVIVIAAAYVDWWAFKQRFPHASFWAWVISPR